MSKVLTSDDLESMAIELAINGKFIERLDDYEKQAIKNHIEFEIYLFDKEVSIGMKNIAQDRIDKIAQFRLAQKSLRMDTILRGLEGIMKDNPDTVGTRSDDEKIDSNPVLAKLISIVAPETSGKTEVRNWLEDHGHDIKKTSSVYNEFREVMKYGEQDVKMKASVPHLEKLITLISDVHPQYKGHLPKIKSYLKAAKNEKI